MGQGAVQGRTVGADGRGPSHNLERAARPPEDPPQPAIQRRGGRAGDLGPDLAWIEDADADNGEKARARLTTCRRVSRWMGVLPSHDVECRVLAFPAKPL